jgi:hypothetical protein
LNLVRPAADVEIDACGLVLAQAFDDDPGTIIFEPDADRRAKLLPGFFRNFIAAALSEDADIAVAGSPVTGVAAWFGPERYAPSAGALDLHGFGEVVEMAGEQAIGRLLAMVGDWIGSTTTSSTNRTSGLNSSASRRPPKAPGSGRLSSSTGIAAQTCSDCPAISRRSPCPTSAITNVAAMS